MESKKISIIVPVYNTEPYIEDCVRSVLRQTYPDYELILVDDGSQDGSGELCEKLCAADKRVKLIYMAHCGVSTARNAGMDAAEGKYLFFLDSDDFIHPQLLEALYNLQEKNQTVIASVDIYFGEEKISKKPAGWEIENDYMRKGFYLANDRVRNPVLFAHSKTRLNAIGGKMILRAAVKDVRFAEDLTHGEDTQFLYRLITNGADVSVLSRKWYYCRKRENSSNMIYSVESCESRYKAQKSICDGAMNEGRILGVVYTELCLVYEMKSWLAIGRKNQDAELEEYVAELIKTEKKTEVSSGLDRCRKVAFYLGCGCYPLYKRIENVAHWYHEHLEIPREFRRGTSGKETDSGSGFGDKF